MWVYEKKLQYPVKVSTCNPTLAKYLMEQYGGADGELAAALRYLNQRYTIPDKVVGLLNEAGLTEHYVNHDHDSALYYNNAAGVPFTATYIQAKGDPIADLYEDIAAEEKARATYQWLIDISDDPDLNDSLRFLREREIVHSQRFREAVEILKDDRDRKKIF